VGEKIEAKMTNKLANENSPYLLQHTDNPVDWYPWGEEALEKAHREDKPIFLSIGYAACHWCHVMAHESFEDPATAAVMNRYFVNIKVDREERPDLDGIYMNAVVAMTGQGGWPMSVFLTPDGKPFYGGTYFPPVRRYNMPSFREVLEAIQTAWQENRDEVLKSSQEISASLQTEMGAGLQEAPLRRETIDEALQNLQKSYDRTHGGWGRAPKFPQPMVIEFLLRQAARGDQPALDTAVHALKAMARGGMYDVVGGGFARYSTDDRWLVPHFEKMLYDNAQLVQVYLYGYLLTRDESLRGVVEETLDFVTREMRHEKGGFYSSLDADSEGEEGKFYVWSLDELRAAAGSEEEANFLIAAYGASKEGNFEGHNVLQRLMSDEELASQFNMPPEEVPARLKSLHARLLEARAKRVRPGTDDKVLTAWNGLMLISFAEAARYLERRDYLQAAQDNAAFLLDSLYQEGRLLRSWRSGRARHNAYLEDYAALILGLLALYQSDLNVRWYREAERLADEMTAHFRDPNGGFFDTRDDHEALVTRPKDLQDNATPSGSSLAAQALLQLAALSGRGELRDLAEPMLKAIQQAAVRYPTAFGRWLCALDFAVRPAYEVAVVGSLEEEGGKQLWRTLWETYRPQVMAASSPLPVPQEAPPLLSERTLVEGKPAAYVCQGFVCRMPVTEAEALRTQLAGGG
jgi:uncharacterized protein